MKWLILASMIIIFILAHVYFECFVKKEKVKNVERGIAIYLMVTTGVLAGSIFMLVTTS